MRVPIVPLGRFSGEEVSQLLGPWRWATHREFARLETGVVSLGVVRRRPQSLDGQVKRAFEFTLELRAAFLGDHIDDSGLRVTVFGIEAATEDNHLLDGRFIVACRGAREYRIQDIRPVNGVGQLGFSPTPDVQSPPVRGHAGLEADNVKRRLYRKHRDFLVLYDADR